jgi:hypothetical protein
MTQYFASFPAIDYNLKSINRPLRVIDISKRFIIKDLYRRNLISYFSYDVKEGERPDNVAFNFYGDPNLDWIILIPNEIIDPYFGWPRNYLEMQSYIREKYGSIPNAYNQIHQYEKIMQKAKEVRDTDGEMIRISEKTLVVDQTTYQTLSPNDRKLVTKYDYEIALNDSRRNISVIDPVYVPAIVDTYRNLYT